jgi:hypothetical protein
MCPKEPMGLNKAALDTRFTVGPLEKVASAVIVPCQLTQSFYKSHLPYASTTTWHRKLTTKAGVKCNESFSFV